MTYSISKKLQLYQTLTSSWLLVSIHQRSLPAYIHCLMKKIKS